ncbi:bacillithiol biosynthesis cysteine-adding enzyme BshC [Terribacillus sp. 7520-G]|uniref:bacillithiol biosynthesis cysteine-adding enzyme BshC n=1 Tax=unclassified Terribacillus TaxID=2636508 RepID=UPI000BA5228B|nr:bacillithiol biosynthesis cysteine-adding enzyme BshC [Terribacillus sp. 7520-G]PAD39968.1 bacillithiol biosynthesis cysteine-adding enzyme BshC [Terribacillus sp. 7520-G]
MVIQPMGLGSPNKLVADYRAELPSIMESFDFTPFHQDSYESRLKELEARKYPREELAELLHRRNKEWGADQATFQNIDRLADPQAVAVVGGQQAGLFTGPLLTLHKITSIIALASEQSEKLGAPVIPVFWIAGEDHDVEEINHIFLPIRNDMKKLKWKQHLTGKIAASDIKLDNGLTHAFLEEVIASLPETAHTKDMHRIIGDILHQSETFVDFFAKLIHYLYKDSGLVLLDSGDPELRNIERPFFRELIEKQREISHGVYGASQRLQQMGYTDVLGAEMEDGNLFCYIEGERTLLVRDAEGKWRGKSDEAIFTEEELLHIAESSPERLSNNVVTRPLMQDYLLPVLAFIAGPGEIQYWANLKPGFEAVGFKMPPVMPRLSFTLLDSKVEKLLGRYRLSLEKAITAGVEAEKIHYLAAQQQPPIAVISEQVKQAMAELHAPLRHSAASIADDLGSLAEKNLRHLEEDIDFLVKRMESRIKEQHRVALSHFDHIQCALHPQNGLQERTWNVFSFWNSHGVGIWRELSQKNYDFTTSHYIVKL